MPDFVDVAVPLGVRKTFAYSVPPNLKEKAACGSRVLVPFGRKLLTGYVVRSSHEPPSGKFKLKAIRDVLDPTPLIPASLMETALWIANYYFTPPGEVIRATIPAGIQVSGSQRIRLSPRAAGVLSGGLRPTQMSPKQLLLLETLSRDGAMSLKQLSELPGLRNARSWVGPLVEQGWVLIEEKLEAPRVAAKECLGIRVLIADERLLPALTPKQRALYLRLDPLKEPVPLQQFLRAANGSEAVAQALARRGVVEIAPMAVVRHPLELTDVGERKIHTLTAAQQAVLDELRQALHDRKAKRYLLHGVTGSGKTEIYLRLIAEVLELGQTALFLVPEIGLTPLLSRIAVSHFPDKVALLHSGMSYGERLDQWRRVRAGEAPVVVGTRSAVFAPLENLRLIIIDEEQDSSYKQDESPYYHAREVAWHRIQGSSGILLMGSATPSIETFHAAREIGEIGYLNLPERIQARCLASVRVVDMGLEFQRHGKKTVVSEELQRELDERLRRGEQTIVMLNRRGYARSLLCRSCGHSFSCSDCSISMTYHQKEQRLICHYCGMEKEVPSKCTNCGGEYIYFTGVGSEQLEEILRASFPKARMARVDRDTTRGKGSLRRMLLQFSEGKLDMLVGTQLLAKGHDFPNVTLVGVVGADAGLSFPDFRSAERTFQLLTQVAGRAGRGDLPGMVVLQCFYPDHYALRFSRQQDYFGFFEQEIEFRRLMSYPPFTRLIQMLIADTDLEKAQRLGNTLANTLKGQSQKLQASSHMRILGPAAAPLEKLRGKYRFQLLIKSRIEFDATPVLRAAFEELGARKVSLKSVSVDVDPLSLL